MFPVHFFPVIHGNLNHVTVAELSVLTCPTSPSGWITEACFFMPYQVGTFGSDSTTSELTSIGFYLNRHSNLVFSCRIKGPSFSACSWASSSRPNVPSARSSSLRPMYFSRKSSYLFQGSVFLIIYSPACHSRSDICNQVPVSIFFPFLLPRLNQGSLCVG